MNLDAASEDLFLRHAGRVTDFSLLGEQFRAVRMIIPSPYINMINELLRLGFELGLGKSRSGCRNGDKVI